MADNNELLDRLNRGDTSAADELFSAYAPYLRAVARGRISDRLRAKFDSSDVVQSVWVQVVRKLRDRTLRVSTEAELRAMLVTITQRRVIGRVRHVSTACNAEWPLTTAAEDVLSHDGPRPSEVAQADDVWAQIVRACPSEHLPVVQYRRQGLSSNEIADRTGLHEGSVRRILRQIARKLALSNYRPPVPDATSIDPVA